MKQRLKIFGLIAIFWMVYFFIARFFFLVYEYSFTSQLSFKEIILTFIYGLRIDLSTAGYIMGIIGLILTFTSITNGKWINKIIQPFTILVLIITSILIIADLELYKNWGYRMDSTPLLYLTKPKEAMASTELWLEILLVLFAVGYVLLGLFVYKRIIKPHALKIKKGRITVPFFLLLLTGSMILPIRGGIGIAPMNTGMVYFSNNKFANHAAINVVWNVMHSLVYSKNTEKSYHFMDDANASQIVEKLNQHGDSTMTIITEENPNIVILILESFSSKVVGAVGGKWDATPELDKLAKEGVLFTNFYASGDRSDKAIISVLGGYPAQPTSSIIKTPSKTQTLPSLFEIFSTRGYNTSFYYGGDIDFANMRSYFLNAGVQKIISVDNFDDKLNNSKWGVHDEYLLNYLYNDLVNQEGPYFKAAFTLSSHDPFDVPMNPVFKGNDRDTKYLNSICYTDSCLGDFFNRIKKTDIWNNTLFILVADHGTQRPDNSPNHVIEKFQIPMLWLGGVLNDSVNVNKRIGSQIDIPATVLSQLGLKRNDFKFSKDLFSTKYSDFAFYAFNDGFGFITDSSKVIYDNIGNQVIYSQGNSNTALIKGQAYLQYLMNDFISR